MKREHETATVTTDLAPVTCTLAELWLLQRCVRHEVAAQETWHFAPASVELNDQIAAALLFCAEEQQPEATLQLSWGDCLAIDFSVPADAKDAEGRPLGKTLLLKTYSARAAIKRGYPLPEVAPVEEPSAAAVRAALAAREVHDGEPGHNPNDDPDNHATG